VHERYWVPYAADPRWHDLNHAAGLCGDDVGLNRFEPKYFGISGVFQQDGNNIPAVFQAPPITDQHVAITAAPGEPILIRFLNGQYFPVDVRFQPADPATPPPLFQVVASDGRPYLDATGYSGDPGSAKPRAQHSLDSLFVTPAERYDLILNTAPDELGGPGPLAPGRYEVVVSFLHWISADVVGIARTTIDVTERASGAGSPTVAITAPTSVRRGDEFTVSATVTNPGTAQLDGLTARLTWSGPLELRDGSAQKTVGTIAGGASQTVSFRFRGTDRGSATVTATVRNAAGSAVASADRALTVVD
jgi:FtsP/CotA-like multicopper oxidase with cupredoxin domain